MVERALLHGGGSNRRTFLLAAFALTGTLLGGRRAAAWIPSEATTSAGRVQGYFSAGIHVFKGVPYAASTTNTRFAAPIPPKPWSGLRPAWQWPAECPQHNPPAGGDVGELFRINNEWTAPQSEDCLALNIWTPGLRDGTKRPVMVWLHGGGFTVGSGSSELYDGANLCNKGDVVVVTLNHRLNLFGYLHLAGTGASERFVDSGNAGMLDIVEALRWIADNIAEFGGDPGNITIFGQSGGGAKVSTLLAMPAARGLFHKAIIQSGPGVRAIDPEDAERITAKVFRQLELDPRKPEALLALPMEALKKVLSTAGADAMGQLRLGPVVDGRSLPRHPFDPAAPAISANVPVLIGCTSDEATSIFGPGDPSFFTLAESDLPGRVAAILGAVAGEAIAAYRAQQPQAAPSRVYISILSDHIMRRGSIEIAERKAAQNAAPAYLYWFKKPSPRFGGKYGALHGIDIPYVFDNVDLAKPLLGEDPSRYPLAQACSAAWIAFARTGNPNTPELPAWRPYSVRDRATMVLDDACRLAVDPDPAVRTVLSKAPHWVF
jgi:para-nitrobenzyl esterase